jgi:RNA polymerase sigma factor (sigma-70 family)
VRTTSSVHDAEDAFQATWYILATKARSIRNTQCLAAWLHRVAVRAAGAARKQTRAAVELTREPSAAAPAADSAEELRILEEEVERLPDRYRLPMVLCYLDGRTNAQAAALLGIPEGTVYSRLARARDRLRARLIRRGVTPSIALAAVQTAWPAGEAVSAALLQQVLRIALTTPGIDGAARAATSIAKGVLQAMWWNQCRKAGVVAVAAMFVGIAVWRFTMPSAAQTPPEQAAQPVAPTVDLAELHRKRVAIAAKVYEQCEAELMAGKATISTFVIDSAMKLLEAERDADPKNELAILKAHRERMAKVRDMAKAKHDVGTVSYWYYGVFELAVTEADLWSEQARRRTDGRQKK